jgi:hypothetical protein
MMLTGLLLAVGGFLMLGLATPAHHRRRFGAAPELRRVRRLRAASWLASAGAAACAFVAQGPVFGPILWCGLVMAGAALAFLMLNLLPGDRSAARRGKSNQ